jgi:hypothetical protein
LQNALLLPRRLSRTDKAGVKMGGYKNGRTARKTDGRLQAAHQRAEVACQFAAKHGKAGADGGWRDCEASAQRARKVGVLRGYDAKRGNAQWLAVDFDASVHETACARGHARFSATLGRLRVFRQRHTKHKTALVNGDCDSVFHWVLSWFASSDAENWSARETFAPDRF